MSQLFLVGLSGKARSGKDTAAAALRTYLGFRQVAFADALKEGSAAMLGLPLSAMSEGDREAVLPEFGFSIRHFLQTMGTECVRHHFGHDFWLKVAMRRAQALSNEGYHRVVISDVRFDNEAEAIRQAGGMVLHITRPGVASMGHVSEQGVAPKPEDHHVANDSTVDEFHTRVLSIVAGACRD